MNLIVKRKQLVLATLVVALGAAVFVNWYYTGGEIKSTEETTDTEFVQNLGEAKYVNATEPQGDSFEEIKFQRKKEQDEAIDKLNASLKEVTSGSEEAKSITASINALTSNSQLQTELEGLIKSKVNSECMVTLSENKAQVVVGEGILNEKTSLQILEIIISNTKINAEDVVMSEQK